MDLDRFTQLVYDPMRTSAEVQQMFKNALAKGGVELADVAREALNKRFPDWDKVSYKKGGPTPTTVMFRGQRCAFPSAKEAYVWLMERFMSAYPRLFTDLNREEIVYVVKGITRNYFGRSPARMFRGSPHLAEDPNNYARLPNGWYVNVCRSVKF